MKDISVFISEEEISKRVKELGAEIRRDYGEDEIILLCILKGSIIFCSDLLRAIGGKTQLEFISASSYGNATETSGQVDISYKLSQSLKGKKVLIVEDIVDTGLTLNRVLDRLKQEEEPQSLKLASLLSKPSRRKEEVQIDYLGFEIEDKFVIGYGLDLAQNFRELPYIGLMNA